MTFMPSPFSIPYTSREVNARAQPGRVFYVDAGIGDNDNSGIRPDEAFLSIIYALTQVRVDANDYIIVLVSGEAAWPVTIGAAHSRVHILGSTNPPGLGQYLSPTGVADEPAFLIDNGSDTVEIAGFNLGAGNTHACIEVESSQRDWIHHCWFGNSDQGLGTPAYGIQAPTGACGFLVVEDCLFLGDQVNVGQGISINGIDITAGAWMTIRRNRFMGCTIGVRIRACTGSMVLDNVFACPDVQGAAITLVAHAATTGCMITGNAAMEGAETAMAANPFEDLNAADINHWGNNTTTFAGGVEQAHRPA